MTPRQSIEAEVARRGRDAVVDGCVALVLGAVPPDEDVDPGLLLALGGPAAGTFLDGRAHDDLYWLKVWGLRGLLWVWDARAATGVTRALADSSWRVRELALKVVARHRVEEATEAAVGATDDPVPRVAAAAQRALRELSTPLDTRDADPRG